MDALLLGENERVSKRCADEWIPNGCPVIKAFPLRNITMRIIAMKSWLRRSALKIGFQRNALPNGECHPGRDYPLGKAFITNSLPLEGKVAAIITVRSTAMPRWRSEADG